MKTRLIALWLAVRYSYWFMPTLMAVLAIVLSFVTIALDNAIQDNWFRDFGWLYVSGPEGARAVLAAVASSMIGIAGVVFSITIVTLTLASSQFGPRLLRNFMRDRGNQIVLGTFIATFTYCLLVLRTVHGGDEQAFVPSLSVTFGVLLALLSLGVLIYFIHHVAASIQAANLIAAVSSDIGESIERLFPQRLGHGMPQPPEPRKPQDIPPNFEHQARLIPALSHGYLRTFDNDRLLHIATERDLLLRLEYRPGQFIIRGSPLVCLWPGTRLDGELTGEINAAFVLGQQRTHEQDSEFAFSQLVEIVVRALSPGVNDPFTATTCLEWLRSCLCQLADRELPSPYRYDAHDTLRVITPSVSFAEIADQILTRIRQYSRSSIMVTLKLLETIAIIAPYTRREADRSVLLRQAIMIERGSHEGLPEEWDRQQVTECYRATVQALEERSPGLRTPYEEQAPAD
jgi:uncharacterized membrane protein